MTQEHSNESWDGGKEVESNWQKFDNVGDHIKGTLLSKRYQKTNNIKYPDQWIYEIKRISDGKVFNVGISVKKIGTCGRLNNCQIGEIIGILLESTTPNKGLADTKNLKVKTWGMDPNYNEMSGRNDELSTEEEIPEM